ncbi:MAG: YihY/virulence factor BrkB family protein [Acidobacteriaceae bacterium]|nr:YihY/virulence factor BrkB family protein [Acidobacteriaceae bacterium]
MNLVPLLKQSYQEWDKHQAPRFGASVALYTLFSFAPLIVLAAAVVGLVFSHEQAQNALVSEASQLIGQRGADSVKLLLQSAQKPTSGVIASIIAFITLLFGASGVFVELREALNVMWDATATGKTGLKNMIKDRLFSFGMVLSVGFLLLVSLLLSACLTFVGKFFGQVVPVPAPILEAFNFLLSFAIITALFALMYKFVPDVRIAWRDVIVGAVGTAFLFTVGKFALGLYLGMASVGSAYGAAGSLVAVIVWVYYSAQIFFFGAEFTHVYAEARGSRAAANITMSQVKADSAGRATAASASHK